MEAASIEPWVYNVSTVYLVLLGIVGNVGNGSVFVAFCRTPTLRTPFNMALVNLIMSDWLIASYGVTVDALAAANSGWTIGESMCTLTGFLLTLAGMNSLFTLVALSVQRWCVVRRHEHHLDLDGWIFNGAMVGLIWIVDLAIAMPPLFGWATYTPESSGISCAPSWEDAGNLGYNVYLLVCGFLVPLILLLTTSIAIIRQIRRDASGMQSGRLRRSARRRENKVTLMVLLMVTSFLTSWSPYALLSLYQITGFQVDPLHTVIPLLFCKSSVCWNPVIYVAMNSQLRTSICNTYHTICCTLVRRLSAQDMQQANRQLEVWKQRLPQRTTPMSRSHSAHFNDRIDDPQPPIVFSSDPNLRASRKMEQDVKEDEQKNVEEHLVEVHVSAALSSSYCPWTPRKSIMTSFSFDEHQCSFTSNVATLRDVVSLH